MSRASWWFALPACLLLAHGAGAAEPLWSGKVPASCEVRLEHPAGDLELQRVRGNTLQVHGQAADWNLKADTSGELLRFHSSAVQGRDAAAATPAMRMELPRGCSLVVRGGSGRVDIHGRHDAPLDVETVTGDITLWAGQRDSLRADVYTSGLIGTDYGIEIEHLRHREPDKHGRVVLGEGSVQARLASRRGVVSVLDREGPAAR